MGKSPKHFVTVQSCELCHRTMAWTPVNYRHTSPRYPDHGRALECASCHTANSQTIPWKFAAYQPDCAACHAINYRPMSHPKFQKPMSVNYTVAELRDCSGACHVYGDNTMRTIITRRSGQHRAIQGGW
jgi:hypothetical protein